LIFELPYEELAIRDLVQNVIQLNVPLIVDLKQGHDWEKMDASPTP